MSVESGVVRSPRAGGHWPGPDPHAHNGSRSSRAAGQRFARREAEVGGLVAARAGAPARERFDDAHVEQRRGDGRAVRRPTAGSGGGSAADGGSVDDDEVLWVALSILEDGFDTIHVDVATLSLVADRVAVRVPQTTFSVNIFFKDVVDSRPMVEVGQLTLETGLRRHGGGGTRRYVLTFRDPTIVPTLHNLVVARMERVGGGDLAAMKLPNPLYVATQSHLLRGSSLENAGFRVGGRSGSGSWGGYSGPRLAPSTLYDPPHRRAGAAGAARAGTTTSASTLLPPDCSLVDDEGEVEGGGPPLPPGTVTSPGPRTPPPLLSSSASAAPTEGFFTAAAAEKNGMNNRPAPPRHAAAAAPAPIVGDGLDVASPSAPLWLLQRHPQQVEAHFRLYHAASSSDAAAAAPPPAPHGSTTAAVAAAAAAAAASSWPPELNHRQQQQSSALPSVDADAHEEPPILPLYARFRDEAHFVFDQPPPFMIASKHTASPLPSGLGGWGARSAPTAPSEGARADRAAPPPVPASGGGGGGSGVLGSRGSVLSPRSEPLAPAAVTGITDAREAILSRLERDTAAAARAGGGSQAAARPPPPVARPPRTRAHSSDEGLQRQPARVETVSIAVQVAAPPPDEARDEARGGEAPVAQQQPREQQPQQGGQRSEALAVGGVNPEAGRVGASKSAGEAKEPTAVAANGQSTPTAALQPSKSKVPPPFPGLQQQQATQQQASKQQAALQQRQHDDDDDDDADFVDVAAMTSTAQPTNARKQLQQQLPHPQNEGRPQSPSRPPPPPPPPRPKNAGAAGTATATAPSPKPALKRAAPAATGSDASHLDRTQTALMLPQAGTSPTPKKKVVIVEREKAQMTPSAVARKRPPPPSKKPVGAPHP